MSTTGANARGEMTLFTVGALLLRNRWRVVRWALAFGFVGAAAVAFRPALFKASASFAPLATDASRTGIAGLAGQFGVALPQGDQTLSPEYYAKLVKSRTLLQGLARDTVVVQELGGRRVAYLDLFEIEGATEAIREGRAVDQLSKIIETAISKPTGIVTVTARTRWRGVSLGLVGALVAGVNDFNQHNQQSQGRAERKFLEGRLVVADSDLRSAEGDLEQFLRKNRLFSSSPDLTLERDRLQREISQRQQLYVTLTQSYEDARIREVRDTPVITVIESPYALALAEPRGRAKVALLGLTMGGFLGVALVLVSEMTTRRREAGDTEIIEFMGEFDVMKNDIKTRLQRITRRPHR